jgi:hypothetical protein
MREYLQSRLVQVGPGFLAFLTFWPGAIALGTGIARVRRGRGEARL